MTGDEGIAGRGCARRGLPGSGRRQLQVMPFKKLLDATGVVLSGKRPQVPAAIGRGPALPERAGCA